VKQKQKAVKRYLKKNPGISITQMDEIMLEGGHQVLWTPPYMPDLQPIELLWARIKNAVARLAVLKRRPDEARRQTEAAFSEVDEEDCEKLVRHVEKWISEWMKQDDGGLLQQYDSFQDLVENGPHVDPTPPESLQEESSDEEEED
jgi:transposase